MIHDLLPFIVIGISTGSVYGLAGTGLVLTYKTSGIFNFAHGSVATLSVFLFFVLRTEHGVPWPLAAGASVLILGPALGALLELLARALGDASHVLKIASTIGILILVLALGHLWFGSKTTTFEPFLPQRTVRILDVNVGWDRLALAVVALLATAGLYCFFRVGRLGAAMRAVVDDASLVAMTGEDPARVRRWAWMIGATFASLSGVLLAPGLSLNGLVLTLLVVQAFGAAAVGMFSSLPLTYAGGVLIGVAGALSTKFVVNIPSLSGLPPGLPFIVLFLALILTPRARLASRRYVPTKRLADPWFAPRRVRLLAGAVIVAGLCFVPLLVGTKLGVWSSALVDVILFLSLGLLIRTSGQVSLCQYGFAAVGAAAMAHFTHDVGIPWTIALILSGLVAIPVGALIAIPAIRLSGVFLALATFGFGILLEQLVYSMRFMFGATSEGAQGARPVFDIGPFHLSTDTGFYYVLLFFAVAASVAVVAIGRSRLGRLLRAMSDSPLALETLGVSVNVARVLAFCISAFMAAIAGALLTSLFTFAVGPQYSSFSSLTLVALLVIIPMGEPWFALVAAAGHQVVPAYVGGREINDYLNALFGVSAAAAVFTLSRYRGAPMFVRRFAQRLDEHLPQRAHRRGPSTPSDLPHEVTAGGGLVIRNLSIAYGGVVAVDDLTLSAPTGQITGLIGPNGAGKTSTFNACCGLLRPVNAEIVLHGQNVSRLGPAARARRGLGRTFQRVELFGSLSVRANIELGRESVMAGARPTTQLLGRRRDSAVIEAATRRAAALTGVQGILEAKVAEISTGQRRLVELARVLAGPFDMILLDEPSSGLDQAETEHFGEVLMRVVREWGVGMLIVEHDMSLVRHVCDRVFVLDFGRLIFEGSPEEMLDDPAVRSAYLGEDTISVAGRPSVP